jgi:hypothetical protein
MKKLLQARIFNNFIFNTDFNTLRNVFSNIDINWEYTSLWTKRNDKVEEITSFKHTRNCSYKIKSISHQLLTGDIQSRNYPLLYKDLTPVTCPNCQENTNNNSHIGKCHKTKVEINQIFKEAKDLLTQLLHDSTDTNSHLIEDSITSLECLKEINLDALDIPDSHHIYLWAHNIIPNELILFLHSHIKTKRQVRQILWQFLDVFMKKIQKITWINRCKLIKQWEKNNNIKSKDKKLYNRLNNKQHSTRSQNSRRHGTTNNFNNNSHSSFRRDDTQEFDPHNSSLFRYYNVHRGKKRKLDNTPSLNNYHLTDWILYTSSNFLHGGHWTNYIASFNSSLLSYYNSIEFRSFYRQFLFLDFSLLTLGLDTDTGRISDHR